MALISKLKLCKILKINMYYDPKAYKIAKEKKTMK